MDATARAIDIVARAFCDAANVANDGEYWFPSDAEAQAGARASVRALVEAGLLHLGV